MSWGGALDNIEVEFSEDLSPSGYIATNIKLLENPKTKQIQENKSYNNFSQNFSNQNNFDNVKKSFNNSNFNIKEYELLEGIYLSRTYEFLDGELIYASSYELSTISSSSTEDSLEKLKSVAVKLGFNALIGLETDSEVEFSISTSYSRGSISQSAFGDSIANINTIGAGCDLTKYYAKARLGLIGVKSETPSNIDLNEIRLRIDTFNSVANVTSSFYDDCSKYAMNFKNIKGLKYALIFVIAILFFIIFLASLAGGIPFFILIPLVFAVFCLTIVSIGTVFYTFFNKQKNKKSNLRRL